jgi:NitT/TauT family transport system ATP-binding protein
VLEVRGLRKVYQPLSGPPVVAIGEVSFRVEEREFVSIVGPSGCGKSTLLQCVAGLTRPSAGVVLLNGREVTGPPEGLILLFQEYNKSLMAWRSVLENVRFGLENRAGMTRVEMDAEARRSIEMVGLGGFERHYPWELSGGMQQRVAIARALANDPPLLLADEPTGNLDSRTSGAMLELFARIVGEGRTLVLVTHASAALPYASRAITIADGRIVGAPEPAAA